MESGAAMEGGDDTSESFTVRQSTAKQQQPSGDDESIISLKMPASTLLQAGASSEFLLPPFSADTEQSSSMTLRKSHDVDDQDKELTIRTEPDSTHIYQQNRNNELIYVGGTTRRITVQTATEVEALGRKARESLEDEQRKRREIVRLEQDPEHAGSHRRESGVAFAEAIRRQRPRPSSTLKRKHTENFSDAFSRPSTGQTDPWTPGVSHITQCTERERSSYIRLHGLPKGVKPESIRKFFSGLDVERIFMLIPNETLIREWDERQHLSDALVERLEPTFRVYVKFVSSPAADMALARSQEYLYSDESDDEKKSGVRIGMTKVAKSIANFLQHNMAIDGVNGSPLDESLASDLARLGPKVTDLLWTMATRDLNLVCSTVETPRGDETKFPWHDNPSDMNPSVLSGYQQLARHYNALVDEYDIMEQHRISMEMKGWDPNHFTDSVMRIERAASDRLLQEIETVKQQLYRAITERRRNVS